MNKLDKQYQALLQDILDNGVQKGDRTGTGTISVFSRQIRHEMSEGFPLLTTKKMYFKGIVTELLWFLRGDTNIKYLVDNDCHIWNGDVYKNYLKNFNSGNAIGEVIVDEKGNDVRIPIRKDKFIEEIKLNSEFAKKWGELGPVYGKQWRSWRNGLGIETSLPHPDGGGSYIYEAANMYIDQIENLIRDLKTNPDSRRLMVSTWNVGELDKMVLPPCHYGFQVYTRELSHEERYQKYWEKFKDRCTADCYTKEDFDSKGIPTRAISLMWNQRSVDTFLGLPFNIASYGLLLEIIAKTVNMVPDELIGNLGDVHLYSNHIEQAKEQIGRELTIKERTDLYRKQQNLGNAVTFSGTDNDFHKVFDDYSITKRTREPYSLPTLKHMKTDEFFKALCNDLSLITHLDSTDFVIEGYQSHPTIKAPLSN
jgi:thymidylate synthase